MCSSEGFTIFRFGGWRNEIPFASSRYTSHERVSSVGDCADTATTVKPTRAKVPRRLLMQDSTPLGRGQRATRFGTRLPRE